MIFSCSNSFWRGTQPSNLQRRAFARLNIYASGAVAIMLEHHADLTDNDQSLAASTMENSRCPALASSSRRLTPSLRPSTGHLSWTARPRGAGRVPTITPSGCWPRGRQYQKQADRRWRACWSGNLSRRRLGCAAVQGALRNSRASPKTKRQVIEPVEAAPALESYSSSRSSRLNLCGSATRSLRT